MNKLNKILLAGSAGLLSILLVGTYLLKPGLLGIAKDGPHDWYVATNGTGQGTSWADATNSLQGAISACASNYTVWVSNGTYVGAFTNYGGVAIKSKTGLPADVIITAGNIDVRTIKMEASSLLIGVTVRGGAGGIDGGSVYNCNIRLNQGSGGAPSWEGGGAKNCTLYNCLLYCNTAGNGGGAAYSTLYNCTVVQNSVVNEGGSTYNCTLYNSICWANNFGGDDPTDPLFVSEYDNLRLQATSTRINAGTNYSWMTNSVDARSKDIDGNARIYNSIVDMGAYEWRPAAATAQKLYGVNVNKLYGVSAGKLFGK